MPSALNVARAPIFNLLSSCESDEPPELVPLLTIFLGVIPIGSTKVNFVFKGDASEKQCDGLGNRGVLNS